MSIDIVLYAAGGKSAIVDFAKAHPPANPLMNDEGEVRAGVTYCWWAGSGQFMTNPAVPSEVDLAPPITPATYLPGVVMLLRIGGDFFQDQKIADQEYDEDGAPQLEQHQRNKIAKYIVDNATTGDMSGVNYWELSGVRLFKPEDVDTFIASRGVPGHMWVGGNNY